MNASTISGHMRRRREELRLTQDDVGRRARALGLRWTRSTVAKIERGTRSVLLEEFLCLGDLLDLDIVELVGQLAAEAQPKRVLPRWHPERAFTDAGDAEVKATNYLRRKHGIVRTPVELAALAISTFDGRSLTEERERRLAVTDDVRGRARAAFRGRVTRKLVAELAAVAESST